MFKLEKNIMTRYELVFTEGSSKLKVTLEYDTLLGVWRFKVEDKKRITGIKFIRIIVEIFNNLPISVISIDKIKAFEDSHLVKIHKTEENREEDYYGEILRLGVFEL